MPYSNPALNEHMSVKLAKRIEDKGHYIRFIKSLVKIELIDVTGAYKQINRLDDLGVDYFTG